MADNSVLDRPSLKLDSIKNNSHDSKIPQRCPNPSGYFAGVIQTDNHLKVVAIGGNTRCKSWSCPFCRPKNLKTLRRRIFNSVMYNEKREGGFRDKYMQKFLTLTAPGQAWRDRRTPLSAYDEMTRAFDKLVRVIKKRHGDFRYLRVVEPQEDGFPHFHVVMVGKAIAHKGVLQEIESLWRFKYGMGFIRMNVITQSLTHAIRYITKYLSKNPVSMGKNKRIFTASRGALEKMKKQNWLEKRFFLGVVRSGKDGDTVVEEKEINLGDPEELHPLAEFMASKLLMDVFGVDLWEEKLKLSPYRRKGEENG